MLHIKSENYEQIMSDSPVPDLASLDLQNFELYGSIKHRGLNIIGGHYCVSPELSDLSNEGEPEIRSFEWACKLYSDARSKSIPATLILFVNDIGISAETRKQIAADFRIPLNYELILKQENVDPGSVVIIFESSVRNRASKEVRKLKKLNSGLFEIMPSNDPRLVRCIDPAYCEIPDKVKEAITVQGPSGEFLVIKEGSNPKCNTILAVLFDRVTTDYQEGLIINCFNSIYRNRIALGTWVYNLMCSERGVQSTPTVNMFFDDEGLVQ